MSIPKLGHATNWARRGAAQQRYGQSEVGKDIAGEGGARWDGGGSVRK